MKYKDVIENSIGEGLATAYALIFAKLIVYNTIYFGYGKYVPELLLPLVNYPEKFLMWVKGMNEVLADDYSAQFASFLLSLVIFVGVFLILNLIYFRIKEGKNIGNIVAVITAATMIVIRLYYGIEGFIGFAHPYWIAFLAYAIISLSLIAKAITEEYTIFLRHTKLFEEDPLENWGRIKIFFWVYFFNPVSVVKIFLRGSKCVAFSIYCHYRPRSSIC